MICFEPVVLLYIKIVILYYYDRLYNYFVSQGALYDRQFGFRKNHSTSHGHALNVSIDHIKTAISNGDHVLGISINLSKAFDTIDHNIHYQNLSQAILPIEVNVFQF